MHLAAYYPWIYLHGGIERTLLELVSRSRHDWRVFTHHYEPASTFEGMARLNIQELRRVDVERTFGPVLGAARRIAMQRLELSGCQGLVVLCDGLGNLITFRNRSVPAIGLCFTPLRAAYDAVYEREALEKHSLAGRLAYAAFKRVFKVVDRRAWRNYAGIVAISSEVRRRIVEHRLYDPARIRICHPGIDWGAADAAGPYEPFLLLPGRMVWTKNIELALRAFLRAALPPPWRLVVAGFVDRKSQPYLIWLRATAGTAAVEFVVNPSDAQLAELYRRCALVLFPPLNEDWGIVPLEAMAYGKLVLANASGGPLESVEDGRTGRLLPPSEQAWAQAIQALVGDPELLVRMGQDARQQARRFDWSAFVAGVDDAIEEWVSAAGSAGARGMSR